MEVFPITGEVRRSAVYTTSSAVIFSPSDQVAFSSICTIKFLLSSVVTESAISPSNSSLEFNSTSGRNIRLVAYLLVSPPSIKSGFNVPSVSVTPMFTISSETSAISVAAAFSPCGRLPVLPPEVPHPTAVIPIAAVSISADRTFFHLLSFLIISSLSDKKLYYARFSHINQYFLRIITSNPLGIR